MDKKDAYLIGVTIYSIVVSYLWLSDTIVWNLVGLSVAVLILTICWLIYSFKVLIDKVGDGGKDILDNFATNPQSFIRTTNKNEKKQKKNNQIT